MFVEQLRNMIISFVMSVCPVHMEQLSSHWTYFCSYFILLKSVNQIQVWLMKSERDKGHLAFRSMSTYVICFYNGGRLFSAKYGMRLKTENWFNDLNITIQHGWL